MTMFILEFLFCTLRISFLFLTYSLFNVLVSVSHGAGPCLEVHVVLVERKEKKTIQSIFFKYMYWLLHVFCASAHGCSGSYNILPVVCSKWH